MNIFEKASRGRYRYSTVKGLIATEDLWQLPLLSSNGFNLDAIAQEVAAELEKVGTKSFVQTQPNPRQDDLNTMLEVVKHVIAFKMQEQANAVARRDRAEKRQKLLNALAKKEGDEIEGLSKEEILKQLEALDA